MAHSSSDSEPNEQAHTPAEQAASIGSTKEFENALDVYMAFNQYTKPIEAADALRILLDTESVKAMFEQAELNIDSARELLDNYIQTKRASNNIAQDNGKANEAYISKTAQQDGMDPPIYEDIKPINKRKAATTTEQAMRTWRQREMKYSGDELVRTVFLDFAEECRPTTIGHNYESILGESNLAHLREADAELASQEKEGHEANATPSDELQPGAFEIQVSSEQGTAVTKGNTHER